MRNFLITDRLTPTWTPYKHHSPLGICTDSTYNGDRHRSHHTPAIQRQKHECAAQGVGNGPDGNSDLRLQSCPSGDCCPYVHWPPACKPRPYEGCNLVDINAQNAPAHHTARPTPSCDRRCAGTACVHFQWERLSLPFPPRCRTDQLTTV